MNEYNSLSNTIEGGTGDDARIETIDVDNLFINVDRTGTLSGAALSTGNNLGINNSLESLTTGFRNTMINNAGNSIVNAQACTSVGFGSQLTNVSGARVTTFGDSNSGSSLNASDLSSFGASATVFCRGANNSNFGNFGMFNLTSGENNTGVGYNNSNSMTTESQNVCLGVNANITAGNVNSIALGYNALTTESNQFRVGDFAVIRFDLGISITLAKPNTTSICMTDNNPALTGTNTTLVGNDTGKLLTTGTWNTAYGSNSLTSCITGDSNTCIGMNAGDSLTSSNNTCVGRSAGSTLTTGTDNVCFGNLSDVGATTSNSVAIGSTTSCVGAESVAIGDSASCSATNSIALGSSATNAINNSCQIGNASVRTLKLGGGMTFSEPGVGGSFSINNSNQLHGGSGGSMICIGTNTNTNLTTANQSLHLGSNSGVNVTSGSSNVMIGSPAGTAVTSESGCVCIGSTSNITAGITNAVALGFGAVAGTSGEIRLGNSAVNKIRGTTTAAIDLGQSAVFSWRDIYSQNAVTITSDARTKDLIESSDLGLNFIDKLHPVKYKIKDYETEVQDGLDEDNNPIMKTKQMTYNRKHYGLIAQEVKNVLDEMKIPTSDFGGYVDQDNLGTHLSLRYNEFIAPMIKAIQELSQKVKDLESRIV